MAKQQKPQPSSTPSSSSSASSIAATPASSLSSPSSSTLPANCPPDVEALGASTWTFLHTLSSSYPPRATPTQQSEMKQFLTLFSKLYPCWHCAEDFQAWMAKKENALEGKKLGGRNALMRWMCEAHNEVNVKLGKERFNCGEGSLEGRWGRGRGTGVVGDGGIWGFRLREGGGKKGRLETRRAVIYCITQRWTIQRWAL